MSAVRENVEADPLLDAWLASADEVYAEMAQTRDNAAARRKVLERFPAGAPRGSWPADEFAAARRNEGLDARVVMDLKSDAFLVVVPEQGGES